MTLKKKIGIIAIVCLVGWIDWRSGGLLNVLVSAFAGIGVPIWAVVIIVRQSLNKKKTPSVDPVRPAVFVPQPPSKKMKTLGITLAILLGALFLNPINLIVSNGLLSVRRTESALCKPETYQPVGETLALYCQSYPLLQPLFGTREEIGLNYAWLPKELNAIREGRGRIRHDSASIEMGGGHYHFGYLLKLDAEASSSATNVWTLALYGESYSRLRHLATFPLGIEQHITPDELFTNLVSRYDACIQNTRSDEDEQEHAWLRKISLYLRFDRVAEARELCKEMHKVKPKGSWATLTFALIVQEEESFERAEQVMLQWVKKRWGKPYAYRWLAEFYQLSGKPGKADDAMRHVARITLDWNVMSKWNKDGRWHNTYNSHDSGWDFDIERLLQRPIPKKPADE